MKFHFPYLLLVVVLLSSCTKHDTASQTDSTVTSVENVQLVAAPSQKYPAAKLAIVSPREGQVLKDANDSVRVVMQVSGMNLGERTAGDSAMGMAYSMQGQHVHIIVDEKPYMADYTNGQPFNVGVLAPGLHTIRAFPSFSWHESIKSANAFATRSFYVGAAPAASAAAPANNLLGPLLTYSRPKGTYSTSEGSKLLLDFYVSNATLDSNQFRVKIDVDGKSLPDVIKWQPYYLTGLGKGKHTLKLQLADAKGNAVPGSYNSPSGEFTIE